MAAWIMGIYFVGFGVAFIALLMLAGIGNAPGMGSGLGSEVVTFILLGSFMWPALLVIVVMAGGVYAIKRMLGKEKNGLRYPA